jgi:hypothetical protein
MSSSTSAKFAPSSREQLTVELARNAIPLAAPDGRLLDLQLAPDNRSAVCLSSDGRFSYVSLRVDEITGVHMDGTHAVLQALAAYGSTPLCLGLVPAADDCVVVFRPGSADVLRHVQADSEASWVIDKRVRIPAGADSDVVSADAAPLTQSDRGELAEGVFMGAAAVDGRIAFAMHGRPHVLAVKKGFVQDIDCVYLDSRTPGLVRFVWNDCPLRAGDDRAHPSRRRHQLFISHGTRLMSVYSDSGVWALDTEVGIAEPARTVVCVNGHVVVMTLSGAVYAWTPQVTHSDPVLLRAAGPGNDVDLVVARPLPPHKNSFLFLASVSDSSVTVEQSLPAVDGTVGTCRIVYSTTMCSHSPVLCVNSQVNRHLYLGANRRCPQLGDCKRSRSFQTAVTRPVCCSCRVFQVLSITLHR